MASVLSERDLINRIHMMRRGESTEYYRGHLSTDAFSNTDVAKLRDIVQRLSTMMMLRTTGEMYRGMGLIILSQRRVTDGFAYLATKVRK